MSKENLPKQHNTIKTELSNIKPIDSETQEQLLLDKVDKRFNYSLLVNTSSASPEDVAVNRGIFKDLCKGTKDDPASGFIFWCDNFVWIQNPRAEEYALKNIPFLLYDYQEKAARIIIEAITKGHDLPIEKSRDMGLSWLIIAIFVWGWNFHGWDVLVGSQKAENVDKRGNMKSLVEKARYITERSPEWLVPHLELHKHDKEMLLIHPINGATFFGESNNPNFGRSDRRKAILFDEFASWEQTDKAAWQACAHSSSCRIPLSTATLRGTNCHFYTVVNAAKKKGLPYLRLHWTLHPTYNKDSYVTELGDTRSPWYDEEVKRAPTMNEVHQELDIDYDASMGDKVFPNFSLDSNVSELVEYDPSGGPVYMSADFGLDTTAFLWWQIDREKGLINVIDEYQNDGGGEGKDIYHYIEILQSKPYKAGIMYGDPHSGENRSLSSRGGSSNASVLRRYGYIFKSERAPITARIGAARNMMEKILISDKCILLIESLSSWQFIKPKSGNVTSETPKHDEYSHIADAFTYFCYNYTNKVKTNVQANKKRYFSTASGVVG